MNYPENTIIELNKYVTNFDNDIKDIQIVEKKINKWINRGRIDTFEELSKEIV